MYQELESYIGQQLTYKKMCEILHIEPKTGNTKISQIKDISRYYKIIKEKTKFTIEEKYDVPLENENIRNMKLKWLNEDEKYEKHGVYYILDEFDNLYIGSTIISFKRRYLGHRANKNVCESKYIMCNNHNFDVLYDMSDIKDEELIRLCEKELIEWFKENTDYNIVNYKIPLKRKKPKTIKVDEIYYEKALKILKENGINIIKE